MRHAVAQSNAGITVANLVEQLERIDQLVSTSAMGLGLGGSDHLGLGGDFENLRAQIVFDQGPQLDKSELLFGYATELSLRAGVSIAGGATDFSHRLRVDLASFELESPLPSGITDNAGDVKLALRVLAHDSNDAVRGRNDIRVQVVVRLAQGPAIIRRLGEANAHGRFQVLVRGARPAENPLDAPPEPILERALGQSAQIEFSVIKGVDFALGQRIEFDVGGGGTIEPRSATVGNDGRVAVLFTATGPAGEVNVSATATAGVQVGIDLMAITVT